MINTNLYNYIDVLDKAADASALRNMAIANNMANVNTPGYKRQDVAFAATLEEALKHSKYKDLDSKVGSLKLSRLRGRVYTDAIGYSYRLDGNNVDIDTEGAELAKNNLIYEGLIDSLKAEFANIRTVTQS